MVRTKGEAGTGNVVEAVRHMRQLWDDIPHSTFWLMLSGAAIVMAFVLLALLRPLKRAMPGV